MVRISTLNYGGINDSPMEFINTSDPLVAAYFEAVSEGFQNIKTEQMNLGEFLHLFFGANEDVETVLANAALFIDTYMSFEIRQQLLTYTSVGNTTTPSLLNTSISTFYNTILSKDKGIGGFEQTNSGRLTNVPVNYKRYMTDGRTLDIDSFRETLLSTYFSDVGSAEVLAASFKNPMKADKCFSDYFMKGRKEGAGGGTKNHYNSTGTQFKYDSNSNSTTVFPLVNYFADVGKLVLCIFDMLSFNMASTLPIPVAFDSTQAIIDSKNEKIYSYLEEYCPDILFLTEYKPGGLEFDKSSSEVFADNRADGYCMIAGDVSDGLCNAIIFKNSLGYFEQGAYDGAQFTLDGNDNEFKEPVLFISNSSHSEPIHLICYHAGGKGILENSEYFASTNLARFVDTLEGQVIVGGDFNCDISDSPGVLGENITLLPDAGSINYTTYKERSPLQAQFDKTGKRDSKVKDGFVLKNVNLPSYEREEDYTNPVMCFGHDEQDGFEVNFVPDVPDDSVLLPNVNHPFDHFLVSYNVELYSYDAVDSFWCWLRDGFYSIIGWQ